MRIGEDEVKFREGDIIYIPEKKLHTITNDHDDEMVEFLAFGGLL